MLLMPISHTIHYKCAFDIRDLENNGLARIRDTVRTWLKSHTITRDSSRKLDQGWFDTGDTEQICVGNGYIRVGINRGDFSSINPQSWALEFIHSDSSEPARLWCTEIGLTRINDSSVRLACMLKHAVFEGWVGELPPDPSFSVPKFVKNIIGSYHCYKSETKIQSNIHQCLIGNAHRLSMAVKDKDRLLPIVVSSPDDNGNDPVDLYALQQIVFGNANVHYLPHNILPEFNLQFPADLGMRPGMVRVYLRYNNSSSNSRIHRFYTKDKISQIGSAALLEQLGIALSRNLKTFTTSEIIRIKDVIHARSLHKLLKLKQNSNEDNDEYRLLLEEENSNLQRLLDDKNSAIDEITEIHDALDEELANAKAKIFHLESGLSKRPYEFETNLISDIPNDIYSCLKIFSKLFNKNIVVLDNAYDSSRSFSGNDNINCIRTAWRMLYYISTTLHDLVFSEQTYDLEKEFLSRTGIDFSMTEGKQTKKDKKLMKLRSCTYEGKEYSYLPHLKGNRRDGFLRIHIAFDKGKRMILICHCGEHIDTYGTQKIS